MSPILYDMQLIDADNSQLIELDYMILACGSDSRAYEILSRFKKKGIVIKKTIVIEFKERLEGIDETDSLHSYKADSIPNLQEISCEIRNPSSCLEDLIKNDIKETDIVGIDISCLTKPYLYFLIKLLKERFKITSLNVFYTEPQSYLFTKGLFNTFHTSSGPLEILEIPGYSGQEERDSKRKLVILLGFDGDLSKEINEDVSPSETIVVNGFPSYTPKFKDISLIANEKLVSDHNIQVEYSKANNPFEVYNLLQSIKEKYQDELAFINVAPLGTKPMALGACLFALHNPTVRVVYPLPENYEKKYADMCWNSWKYVLPLTI